MLLPVPLLLNDYQQFMLNLVLIYVPVGIGFNIVLGNLGLLAFSNVAYFGLGAYTSGILMAQFAVPWFVTLLPVIAVGACAGCIAGFPALRGVRLFYLAIMTLAFGELMRWLYIRWESVTGGSMGMVVPPSAFPLDTDLHRFYVFLAIAVLGIIATHRLLRSRFGRAFEAIRGNEIAAAAMGIHTDRLILLGFAWDGALTAIAGAMLAISIGHITPDSFDLNQLIVQFAIVMVGTRQPRRLGDRCTRYHRTPAILHQLPRISGTRLRCDDRADHPVSSAWPRRPDCQTRAVLATAVSL